MKSPRTIVLLLLTCLALHLPAADVTFRLTTLTSAPATNRWVLITPKNLTHETALHLWDRQMFRSDSAGAFVVSNMLPGYYTVEVQAPPDRTAVLIGVPSTAGALDAAGLVVSPTNLPSGDYAYSIPAADARFSTFDWVTNYVAVAAPAGQATNSQIVAAGDGIAVETNGLLRVISSTTPTNWPASAITNPPWLETNSALVIAAGSNVTVFVSGRTNTISASPGIVPGQTYGINITGSAGTAGGAGFADTAGGLGIEGNTFAASGNEWYSSIPIHAPTFIGSGSNLTDIVVGLPDGIVTNTGSASLVDVSVSSSGTGYSESPSLSITPVTDGGGSTFASIGFPTGENGWGIAALYPAHTLSFFNGSANAEPMVLRTNGHSTFQGDFTGDGTALTNVPGINVGLESISWQNNTWSAGNFWASRLSSFDGSGIRGLNATNLAYGTIPAATLANITLSGPLYSSSPSSNAPAPNELVQASWVRSLFLNGFIKYNSTNESAGSVYGLTPMIYLTNVPAYFSRTYTTPTNNQYVGVVALTNMTSLSGPVVVSAYLCASGGTGGSRALHVKPEIYYSYDNGTNLLGDWDCQPQSIALDVTNRYDFVIPVPQTTFNLGGATVYRVLKVTSATGTTVPNLIVSGGTNFPGQISYNTSQSTSSSTATATTGSVNATNYAGLVRGTNNTASTVPAIDLGYFSNNVPAITFTNRGNGTVYIGINNTNPTSALHVSGAIATAAQITAGTVVQGSTVNASATTATPTNPAYAFRSTSSGIGFLAPDTSTIQVVIRSNVVAQFSQNGFVTAQFLPYVLSGTNVTIYETNGNLQRIQLTNATWIAMGAGDTNYHSSIYLEVLGSNTVYWSTATLSNSAYLQLNPGDTSLLFDRNSNTNLWWATKLR